MTIKNVLKMGNEQLLQPSVALDNFSQHGRAYPKLNELIADMFETMIAADGAGIAAPQIGVNLRVVIFGSETIPKRYRRYGEIVPLTILINPVIKPLTHKLIDGWEGCLSVPGLRGLVPRFQKIEYSGFDITGQEIRRVVENFHARVVQHEVDHLDGILYPQRIKDLRYFGFEEELSYPL